MIDLNLDYKLIDKWIQKDSTVLDLGCGDGDPNIMAGCQPTAIA